MRAGGRAGEVYNIGGGTEPDQPRGSPSGCSLRPARTGAAWCRSRTARVTTAGTASTSARSAPSLGYAPQVEFDAGLADAIEWYRGNREWWERLKQR
ncbi:hypothetical protein GCM10025868_28260 [Angustibacter aerolatus]|uniref:NAD(P)-binding domain-containing protein n=1 Tax=Angustibacter aerolatus TaxID=1162965 RepID=A0ABQ6JL97_9ACTN|nr:hypothetical protein GCM10025868_28260 [Angustibacter aerolatus]